MLSELLLTELHHLQPSKLPLHRQLYEVLRRAILDGKLATDERLPSSRDLMHDLHLSRNTVVARKHRCDNPLCLWPGSALPACHEQCDLFQSAERSGRLGQLALTLRSLRAGCLVDRRQMAQGGLESRRIVKPDHDATNPSGGVRVMKCPFTPSGQSA